jgi:hypothetical protein
MYNKVQVSGQATYTMVGVHNIGFASILSFDSLKRAMAWKHINILVRGRT